MVCVIGGLGCLVLAIASQPDPQPDMGPVGVRHPAVGKEMPEIALEPLTGDSEPVRLSDLKGQPTLVNFWGEWCGPCQMEFPHLVRVRNVFEPQGVFFASVSCGDGSNPEVFADLSARTELFLKRQNEKNFATHWDPDARTRRGLVAAAELDGFAYPTTVLLDDKGSIRGLWQGYWEGMEKDLETAVLEVLHASNE